MEWGREDSNLRRLSQQIYSLPPLTARELPHFEQGAPYGAPLKQRFALNYLRASGGNRTRNLLITNQPLCQLSYASF